MQYHQAEMFPPATCGLAITARRDRWGVWSVRVSRGIEGPDMVEWEAGDTYHELTRDEVVDVVEATVALFGGRPLED